jgi:hypothetical protein
MTTGVMALQLALWLLIWCAGSVLVAVVLGGVARLRDTLATPVRVDDDQTQVRRVASPARGRAELDVAGIARA